MQIHATRSEILSNDFLTDAASWCVPWHGLRHDPTQPRFRRDAKRQPTTPIPAARLPNDAFRHPLLSSHPRQFNISKAPPSVRPSPNVALFLLITLSNVERRRHPPPALAAEAVVRDLPEKHTVLHALAPSLR